ncbi:13150_t:CDS:2 [Funneliformis caledonium]|uniref:13150_t:CDS:1 n=1 Tax=Funneliformis caledonium TaxID=1117310 RepID=A0A9N8ZQA0_9GLOM|nr:13150_t:CDS:2 [Funneliformis caledonium]
MTKSEVTEDDWMVWDVINSRGQVFVDEIKIHELIQETLPDTSWEVFQDILLNLYEVGLVRKRQTHDERYMYQARSKETAAKLQSLENHEFEVYELIENSERKGISKTDIQKQSKLVQSLVEGSLKNMQDQKLIKEVKPKTKKLYMLFDTKPHDESLSRLIYTNGEPDTFVVETLKSICYNFIYHRSFPRGMDEDAIFYPNYTGYVTLSKIVQCVQETKVTEIEIEEADIRQILDVLIFEGKIIKKFMSNIDPNSMVTDVNRPDTQFVYIAKKARNMNNAWTQAPCGRCPFFENECTENGEISPSTCIFFPQWLNKAINIIQDDEQDHGKGKEILDW